MIHWRLFKPILAGATATDRALACAGAAMGIAFTGAVCLSLDLSATFLVAPMGASAVLIFVVPASPLAQPWPVIGGNTLSALVGVLVASLIPEPSIAAGVAVAAAIAVMSLTRCLHPPGGAAALLAVLSGPGVRSAGFLFALSPVAFNAVLLTLAGLAYHRLVSGHSYPHRAIAATGQVLPRVSASTFTLEDVEGALSQLGETFDVSREDLDLLLQLTEQRARDRQLRS